MSRLHLCSLLAFLLNSTSALVNNVSLLDEPNDLELKFYANCTIDEKVGELGVFNCPPLDDIELQFYSNGTIDEKVVELGANSVVRILSVDLPERDHFSVVQAHSQIRPVTLGREEVFGAGNHVNGTSVGIVVYLSQDKPKLMAHLFNPHPVNITVMVFMITYNRFVPVPGACNSTFEVGSPTLGVSYNENIVSVDHQFASLPPNEAPNTCKSSNTLRYNLYHYYLTRGDLTQESFFEAIRLLRTVRGAQKNGKDITSHYIPANRYQFSTYPGVGRVFVVTVTYDGHFSESSFSAYVPSITYGCRLDVEGDCEIRTISGNVLCALSLVIGVFLLSVGHHYFETEMFLIGFAILAAILYIILDSFTTTISAVIWTVVLVVGLLGGAFWLFVWTQWGIPKLSIIPVVILFAFIVGANLCWMPLSLLTHTSVWLYWTIFCGSCILTFLPIILKCCSMRVLNIVSVSLLGLYAVIFSIDYWIVKGNFQYSVLNVVRRATVPGYADAILYPPFQTKDWIMFGVWIVGSVCIALLQYYLFQRQRPPFPPPNQRLRYYINWFGRRSNATEPSSGRVPSLRRECPSRPVRIPNSEQVSLIVRAAPVNESTPLIRPAPPAIGQAGSTDHALFEAECSMIKDASPSD